MADFDLLATSLDIQVTVSIPTLVFTAGEVEEPEEGVGGGGSGARERRGRISADAWLEAQGIRRLKNKPAKSPKKRQIAAEVQEHLGTEPAFDSVLIPLSQADELAQPRKIKASKVRSLEYKRERLEAERQAQEDEEIAVFLMMMAAA